MAVISSTKVGFEKGDGSLVSKLRRLDRPERPEFIREIMMLAGIVVQRDTGMVVQDTMNFVLNLTISVSIEFGDMEH